MRNLTRNAVEHTEPDGLVRLEAVSRPAGLEIAVVDDGPGIPPEERTRVFDRLHRVDAARTRPGGGAGLGLAITRAVVEAHGGRVWAEAAPTGGARVALLLPGFRPADDSGTPPPNSRTTS